MPRSQLILLGCLSCPHKITQCFLALIRNPDRRQIVGTMTACKLQRVPPVRLDPVTSLLLNQRRSYDCALYSQLCQLPAEYKPRRAGFVTGPQLICRSKPFDQLVDRLFAVGYRTQTAYLATWLGYRNRYRFGMDIQTQKS
jgi:hypothetical protein